MFRLWACLLVSLCLLLTACRAATPTPPTPTTGITAGTTTTTTTAGTTVGTTTATTMVGTTTAAPTETYPTRATATRPAAIEVPADAFGYNIGMTAGPADMLFWGGELYHAVMLETILPPAGEAVGHITEAVERDVLPAAEGQCNQSTLVGQKIYQVGDCLYTAPAQAEGDPVYRQWQKGRGTCPGFVVGGWGGLQFEGHDFWQLRWFEVKEGGALEGDFLTADTLPADKGFVWAGQILAQGLAARVEFGNNFGGLGRDLYASAAYPNFLYAGNEETGYWVLVTTGIPLTCGSIRQEEGSRVLDLTAAAEEDIAYLATVLHAGTTDLVMGGSLEMFGIAELKLPADSKWADTFRLAE